ncbi:MAG: biotin-dependent carboxyltransferase family protein [Pseudomonadales bacterium]|nr:biotin-dependent carboxyltransferase family protein [Pseudomonadales bacterium]
MPEIFLKAHSLQRVVEAASWGRQLTGQAPGGPADLVSAREANLLVSNPATHPLLEVTLSAGELFATVDIWLSINGATLPAKRVDESGKQAFFPNHKTVLLKAGSKLVWEAPKQACRAYIAIYQGWLGDSETVSEKQGYAVYRVEATRQTPPVKTRLPLPVLLPNCERPRGCIRVLPGPEASEKILHYLFQQRWQVSPVSGLQGLRLLGDKPPEDFACDIVSAPVQDGTIQLTPDGPIALLRERQTVGGYARIAQIIADDVNVLAQFRPGDTLRFISACYKRVY